ncbi:MAG: VWA domain-containing protein, partial [Deltaproteobacteria bacterium]|nr:VWA domain-containing protein [Deltaproteobacteria bacterium]
MTQLLRYVPVLLLVSACAADSLTDVPLPPQRPVPFRPPPVECDEESVDAIQMPVETVKPNMLIILDASGSMTTGTPTRWDASVTAIKEIVAAYGHAIRFGLSVFPSDGDCGAGQIDVPVSDTSAGAISTVLDANAPTGMTPIAGSLNSVLANPFAAGLGDENRDNFILLVTDGEETC